MRLLWVGAAGALLWTLSGCGGGSSAPQSEEASSQQPVASGISGAVVKGPVSGAQVCAYELLSSGKGSLLECTSTASDGSYSLPLPFAGDVILEASGGSYLDEATGATAGLSAPLMSIVTTQAGATATAAITPLTHFAYIQAGTELSATRFGTAANTVRAAFELTNLDLVAQLPVVGPDGQGNEYGKALGTVSQALRRGATLGGLARSVHTALAQEGLRRAEDCSTYDSSTAATYVIASSNEWDILVEPPASQAVALAMDVYGPAPAWRINLLAGGKPASCTVTVDTAEQVSLLCASGTEYGSLTVLAGGSPTDYVPSSSPGHLVAAGARVRLAFGSAHTVERGSTLFLATTGVLQINGSIGGGYERTSLNSGLEALFRCSLNPDGSVQGLSQVSIAGATQTNSGGTLTTGSGFGIVEPATSLTPVSQQSVSLTGTLVPIFPPASISLSGQAFTTTAAP